jgi:hypothetical protein
MSAAPLATTAPPGPVTLEALADAAPGIVILRELGAFGQVRRVFALPATEALRLAHDLRAVAMTQIERQGVARG